METCVSLECGSLVTGFAGTPAVRRSELLVAQGGVTGAARSGRGVLWWAAVPKRRHRTSSGEAFRDEFSHSRISKELNKTRGCPDSTATLE